jgi:nucleotide-binding universal stress UspA family protein
MVATVASSPAPIVVPIDFDQPSVYALRRGAEIFRRSPAFELEVLHVIERTGLSELESDWKEVVTRSAKKLQEFMRAKLADPSAIAGRQVGLHVRTGNAVDEIVRFADEVGAQLIVVGSHGRKGLAKKILGSTSEKILELAHTSVVIASGDPSAEAPAIEPPCPDCQSARRASKGQQWWCARHAETHPLGHSYSYRSEWPTEFHDSEVIPTGIDIP